MFNRLKVTIISLMLTLSACAKSDKAPTTPTKAPDKLTCATFVGVYDNLIYDGETAEIFGDCTFTDSICGYQAEYTLPDKNGEFQITVGNTNGTVGCMSNTVHDCVMETSGDELAIACDNETQIFYFDRR